MNPLSQQRAISQGYSSDKRKRRRQHRRAAREIQKYGFPAGFIHTGALWHLAQARALASG